MEYVLNLELLTIYNLTKPKTPINDKPKSKEEYKKELEQVKQDFREFDRLAQKAAKKAKAGAT